MELADYIRILLIYHFVTKWIKSAEDLYEFKIWSKNQNECNIFCDINISWLFWVAECQTNAKVIPKRNAKMGEFILEIQPIFLPFAKYAHQWIIDECNGTI